MQPRVKWHGLTEIIRLYRAGRGFIWMELEVGVQIAMRHQQRDRARQGTGFEREEVPDTGVEKEVCFLEQGIAERLISIFGDELKHVAFVNVLSWPGFGRDFHTVQDAFIGHLVL